MPCRTSGTGFRDGIQGRDSGTGFGHGLAAGTVRLVFTAAEYLDIVRTELDRIRATPASALDAGVAGCPGWAVRDLIGHHDGVLRFVTAQLRAEPGSDLVPFDPPPDGVAALESFGSAADALLAELVATDPDEHRPNWADAPDARFWFRRMAHEATIHRWDVESAHTTPVAIDAELAADGISEFGDVYLIHAARRGITGAGETVHLHATDPVLESIEDTGEWMYTFGPEGVEVEHTHGKGDMAVRGPADQLLLFVWNRRPVSVDCFGDPDPLEWWPARVRI